MKQDEDALLEEAINLAAAEREQLGAAARNDAENNVERCDHGFSPWPRGHVCAGFVRTFAREFNDGDTSVISDKMFSALKVTVTKRSMKYDAVWNDPDLLEQVMSYFLAEGTDMLLRMQDDLACRSGALVIFFEMRRDRIASGGTLYDLWSYRKANELSKDTCDEHTLVSFFRKRIPCKCLDKRYKEVKSIEKMGHCDNPDCPLPDGKAVLSKFMNCERCQMMKYCSIECQKANWPYHKEFCASVSAEQKARQTK